VAVGLCVPVASAPGTITPPLPVAVPVGAVAVGVAPWVVPVGPVRVAVGLVALVVPGTTPVRVPVVPVAPGLTHDTPVAVAVTPGAGTPGTPGTVRVVDRVVAPGEVVPWVCPPVPVSTGGWIWLGSCGTSDGCAAGFVEVPVARPAAVNIPATTAAGTMSATAMPRLVRPRVRCSGIVIPPRVVSGPQASTPNS
jgi:hypothetical protein